MVTTRVGKLNICKVDEFQQPRFIAATSMVREEFTQRHYHQPRISLYTVGNGKGRSREIRKN